MAPREYRAAPRRERNRQTRLRLAYPSPPVEAVSLGGQSDESPIYTGIGWRFQHHGVVTHSKQEYVHGDDYTNTVEGYFSILKRACMASIST